MRDAMEENTDGATPVPPAADQTPPMDRREALKVLAVAAASGALAEGLAPGRAEAQQAVGPGRTPRPRVTAPVPPKAGPRGTATDPDLITPASSWPRLLSAAEMTTLAALCDMIIPADDKSPSASAVGAHRYINEYVSAPYDWAERALVRIRGGLTWLDVESGRRFGGRRFTALTVAERTQICDDICHLPRAKPEHQAAARFFDQVRDLTASGFYTTDAGMKDLQYVGNVPLSKFDGPPPEVLRHLGL
ncbi:MAG: gluconate 2-dehydrogenase subunit 3 family protein [Gemmatimonadaceae bacterium]|nr:gluconate 2-dehydrogenase subunit 3 family protein [Gemmatimonadaceae bacterium]